MPQSECSKCISLRLVGGCPPHIVKNNKDALYTLRERKYKEEWPNPLRETELLLP
jgi:hypothetical protein